MTAIELDIKEIFFFGDGRTVLVGPVYGEAPYIPPGEFEVWINNQKHSKIRIEGEMIPCGASHEGFRSVSTRDTTGLDRELVAKGHCLLKSVG